MVIKKFLNLRKTKVINWLKKLHEKSGLWLENRQKIMNRYFTKRNINKFYMK